MKRHTLALIVAVCALVLAPLFAQGATVVFPAVRSVTDPIPVQTTATTGAGTIVDLHHRLAMTVVWIYWNGNCTEGVVEVQVSMTDAGPWRTVATLTHQNATPDWVVLNGSPGVLRTSITTPVEGGTVSSWVTGW